VIAGVSDPDRIRELESQLARASHERDEYKKLYELVMLELERVKRHLRAQNKSERVDAQQVQLSSVTQAEGRGTGPVHVC
jgi:transposase